VKGCHIESPHHSNRVAQISSKCLRTFLEGGWKRKQGETVEARRLFEWPGRKFASWRQGGWTPFLPICSLFFITRDKKAQGCARGLGRHVGKEVHPRREILGIYVGDRVTDHDKNTYFVSMLNPRCYVLWNNLLAFVNRLLGMLKEWLKWRRRKLVAVSQAGPSRATAGLGKHSRGIRGTIFL